MLLLVSFAATPCLYLHVSVCVCCPLSGSLSVRANAVLRRLQLAVDISVSLYLFIDGDAGESLPAYMWACVKR